jgi:protein O-mannosyl-transferase
MKSIVWIILIALLGAGLYTHSANYGYSADDGIYSYSNRVTKEGLTNWTDLFKYGSMNFIEIDSSNSSIYRPLTLLTFSIEREIFGEFKAGNGHIFNLILYFGVLVVVGLVLLELFKKRELPYWIALIVLLLYAVHPIHTEVVASVKSRDTLIASFFAFSSILIWIKGKGNPGILRLIFTLILFFLSLISKEETLTLLAFVFCISYFFDKKNLINSIKTTFPFLAPVILYMLIRAIILDPASTIHSSMVNSVLYGTSSGEQIATNLYIYWQYIKLLFIPHPLSWDYSFSQISVQTFSNPIVWLSLVFFAGLGYTAYRGFKSRSLFSFGIIFYLASFSIFANLTKGLIIGSNLGERFLFIPSLAFSFLVVYGCYVLANYYSPNKVQLILGVLFVPIILAFSWKTIDRTKVWESNLTLLASGIETSPNSWRTHMYYGVHLRILGDQMRRNSPDSAKMYYQLAVNELDLGYEIIDGKVDVPQFFNPLSEAWIGLGDTTKAMTILRKVVKENPNSSFAFIKLASLASKKQDFVEAENWYLEGLRAPKPDHFILFKGLGAVYDQQNENKKAIVSFRKALEFRDDRAVRRSLGFLYFQEGDEVTAMTYFPKDEEIDMEEVRFVKDLKIANIALKNEDYPVAVAGYQSIEPRYEKYGGKEKYPDFFAAFGKSLIETGDTLKSKEIFLKAYELNSNQGVVCTNLGVIAFFHEKNYLVAERYFQEAINAGVENLYSSLMNLGSSQLMNKKEAEAVITFEKALEIRATRSVVGNLYLLHKSLGNTEKSRYYFGLLQPSSVSQ